MCEHNNLYYIFLWDVQRVIASEQKEKYIQQILKLCFSEIKPKQGKPPPIITGG